MELRTKEHESLNALCGGSQKLEGKKDYTQVLVLHKFRKLKFFKKLIKKLNDQRNHCQLRIETY